VSTPLPDWHFHYFQTVAMFVHTHPGGKGDHDHHGFTLVSSLGRHHQFVDIYGNRLGGERTPIEALETKRL